MIRGLFLFGVLAASENRFEFFLLTSYNISFAILKSGGVRYWFHSLAPNNDLRMLLEGYYPRVSTT